MCNDYEAVIEYARYIAAIEASGLQVPIDQSTKDLPQAADIRIGEMGSVLRVSGNGAELVQMRFGWPPPRPRASPVFNFRSDGRHFDDSRRCLVVCSAFFEFTGTKSPKTKHRFSLTGSPVMGIASLWKEDEAGGPLSFTMLTTEPGPDIAPIHGRQICVLQPERWADWLHLTRPESELLRPMPAGSLEVATIRR